MRYSNQIKRAASREGYTTNEFINRVINKSPRINHDSEFKHTSVIFRHDLHMCDWKEIKAFSYSLSYRELFVYLVIVRKFSFSAAFDAVDSKISLDKYMYGFDGTVRSSVDCGLHIPNWDLIANIPSWDIIDNFSLDGSKTFINGRRYL